MAGYIAAGHAEEENCRRAPKGVYFSYWTVLPFDISLSAVLDRYYLLMKAPLRSNGKIALVLVGVFSLAAAVTVCILPYDGEGLHYLVAGTLGSGTMLAGAFGLFISGRLG